MKDAFMTVRSLGIAPSHSGKVRETIDLGNRLWIVTTDRISAFDCVLPEGLSGKGVLLNQLATFWFRGLADFVPTHFIGSDDLHLPEEFAEHRDVLKGRWMLVRKAERVPVECVVRGYLAGSGWAEYKKSQTVCGIPLPKGLQEFDRLPKPLFTPTTKEDEGHDQPLTPGETKDLLGPELAAEVERLSIEIYERAANFARQKGIVIADTKFEFGHIDGRLSLIDEALTPDSSRFWPLASLRDRGSKPPESWDKQFVRDYLKTLDWNREPPAPGLPPEIETEALDRYKKACLTLTENRPEPDWSPAGSTR